MAKRGRKVRGEFNTPKDWVNGFSRCPDLKYRRIDDHTQIAFCSVTEQKCICRLCPKVKNNQ